MTECINVYRATQSIARSLLSCGVRLAVRLFVTLMYRNGQFLLSNFFIAWWPHHSSFPKGKIYLNSEFILTVKFRQGHPQQGRQIQRWVYQKFSIFNQYFRNTDTDTEYRGISKYRYRIPNRHEKIPTKNTEYRYRLKIPIPTQLYCELRIVSFI